jgi:3-deoxy-D-manno-octulosonate 8-phosphate phosphatase (KDO 8-P phosphatase)|tara:strand:- start:4999 stop:5514 length:516 start_codon:yes stop_codon:yes gene_type:complete
LLNKKIDTLCKNVKLIITDVDGVLTDGGMYYLESGEIFKKFNTRDGMGVELLLKNNIKTILMTKENSIIAKKRGKKINAVATYINVKNKEERLDKICKKFNVTRSEIGYIGDDVNDYKIMKMVGFSATPANGVKQIKNIANFITETRGGEGVFREVADTILFAKNIKTDLY